MFCTRGCLVLLALSGCEFTVDGVAATTDDASVTAAPDFSGVSDDGGLPPADLTGIPGDFASAPDMTGVTPADMTGTMPMDMTHDLTPVTGVLTGAIANVTVDTTNNLSTEGNADWAHWGLSTATSFDHKTNGNSQISNFTSLQGNAPARISGYHSKFTWSDGTPNLHPNDAALQTDPTDTGVYLSNGQGEGFRITAPADTTQRVLKIYCGGQMSTIGFTAHLSDGSAADYTASTGDMGQLYERTLTLTYRAASAGQTLTVSWSVSSNNGFVDIKAASLHQ